jgi:hypothetical protein
MVLVIAPLSSLLDSGTARASIEQGAGMGRNYASVIWKGDLANHSVEERARLIAGEYSHIHTAPENFKTFATTLGDTPMYAHNVLWVVFDENHIDLIRKIVR